MPAPGSNCDQHEYLILHILDEQKVEGLLEKITESVPEGIVDHVKDQHLVIYVLRFAARCRVYNVPDGFSASGSPSVYALRLLVYKRSFNTIIFSFTNRNRL